MQLSWFVIQEKVTEEITRDAAYCRHQQIRNGLKRNRRAMGGETYNFSLPVQLEFKSYQTAE